MSIESLFETVQKSALPGIWSQGVSLARTGSVILDSLEDDEAHLRIHLNQVSVSPRVTLWLKEDDWFCDTPSKADPNAYVVAAIIALKSNQTKKQAGGERPSLEYRFTREGRDLFFDRWLMQGEQGAPLKTNLVSIIGGIQSGRIKTPPVTATKQDYAADAALSKKFRGKLDSETMIQLLRSIDGLKGILLDGKPIEVSSRPIRVQAKVSDENGGYRLKKVRDPSVSEVFNNGAVLCGNQLRPAIIAPLTSEERMAIANQGSFYTKTQASELFSEILPRLERKIEVIVETRQKPKIKEDAPRIVLHLEKRGQKTLAVTARLLYGSPPVAEVKSGELVLLKKSQVPIRDVEGEKQWILRLKNELLLQPNRTTTFQGAEAIDFTFQIDQWEKSGSGYRYFRPLPELKPDLKISDSSFALKFSTASDAKKDKWEADPAQVFEAWQENWAYVPLIGGGWAPLPKDWLEKNGDQVLELLESKDAHPQKKLPKYMLPDLARLSHQTGQECPDTLISLKDKLQKLERLPSLKLPKDLKATLRPYQKMGVRWLHFLREMEMGAMLADDMGLGKTLQALCSLRGKSLIICPTSVLDNWAIEIEKFRPALRYHKYYGPQRRLIQKVDVTLTTYGVLRLDQEVLCEKNWNTVILDEAQIIKNPESQVALAAHRLGGDFRIALSGTPVENRLDDLWSQFRFLNPGLLRDRKKFLNRYARPIAKGDTQTGKLLRERIRPFILRRMKQDVAPELPPRTETLLHCELTLEERKLYDSILNATREEVLKKLKKGKKGSVFAALEILLRLRQVCCHSDLIPGQKADTSSKVSLLIEKLSNSIEMGHRSLVFSQWTGFLDRIEPHLKKQKISFSRIDGSTRNRAQVVEEFQKPDGPEILLISLKAGGVGLNLTAADHIYLLDPWWNPAVEDQAADRAHRIGQTNPVLIHRLVAKETIEDRVIALQKNKTRIADTVLEGSDKAASISREDILALLE